ncbi:MULTISPECIES: hypothetical protein [unclassified Flavobacterium]|jgi:hypothetical protein|uniref:hypothetical protein n=1 Tax=unclassified Flavobacterium TaxID=196869 RepID=UPI00057F02D0|nr:MULTISPECIES: hypothetical protein [unclassified Flavobacterium]KIA94022.1 hypothetical protein OA93_21450 [Flavobacterium sp. KMS]KIC02976.1 hypothetical protein OA88_05640 [Flavobacterium sp. JRM]MEA9414984.1 hypothetical protein [Flavobacterium sp. PL02]OUL61716.1 hypothetical protein B8T70_13940 [Flavobacterium sp. AJR]
MKTIQTAIVFAFMLFFANSVSAQYGNGYGNGYGGGGYGGGGYGGGRMNGSMSQGMGQMGNTSKPKETPVEEIVATIMEELKPELNLDALQEIAVSNVLIESIKEQGILLKNESSSQDDKIKQIQALSEVTNKRVSDFLNKDQKEKYTVFMEQRKNQTGSKKAKKKKK